MISLESFAESFVLFNAKKESRHIELLLSLYWDCDCLEQLCIQCFLKYFFLTINTTSMKRKINITEHNNMRVFFEKKSITQLFYQILSFLTMAEIYGKTSASIGYKTLGFSGEV
jgi:hypothetical protein